MGKATSLPFLVGPLPLNHDIPERWKSHVCGLLCPKPGPLLTANPSPGFPSPQPSATEEQRVTSWAEASCPCPATPHEPLPVGWFQRLNSLLVFHSDTWQGAATFPLMTQRLVTVTLLHLRMCCSSDSRQLMTCDEDKGANFLSKCNNSDGLRVWCERMSGQNVNISFLEFTSSDG